MTDKTKKPLGLNRQVEAYALANPEATYREVAEHFNVLREYVVKTGSRLGFKCARSKKNHVSMPRVNWEKVAASLMEQARSINDPRQLNAHVVLKANARALYAGLGIEIDGNGEPTNG